MMIVDDGVEGMLLASRDLGFGWFETPEGTQIRIGKNCKIGRGCKLGDFCQIGNNCELGEDCEVANFCQIGDYCALSSSCFLFDSWWKMRLVAKFANKWRNLPLGKLISGEFSTVGVGIMEVGMLKSDQRSDLHSALAFNWIRETAGKYLGTERTCGTPQCCPQCCKIEYQRMRIAELEAEVNRVKGPHCS